MKSGFAAYTASGRCDAAVLRSLVLKRAPLFALGGAVYQAACDGFGGGGAAAVAGFVSAIALLGATPAVVRKAHCRSDDAGMAAGAVLGLVFLAASWAVALGNAASALDDPQYPRAGPGELFRERWGMRELPWVVWLLEGAAFVFLPGGAASSEADKPYCEDVRLWAEPRVLGVASEVDGTALRRRALDGDLVGLFTVASAHGGRDKARFVLLTAPDSVHQYLSVVLLETPKSGKLAGKVPDDDDAGTDVVEAAVLTADERAALEAAFPAPGPDA